MTNTTAAGAQRGSSEIPAGLVDMLRGLPIDAQEFADWLGPRLGAIRAELAYRDSQPSRAERGKTFKDLAAHVAALRDGLGVGGLAVSERALLRAAAAQQRVDLAGLRERLRADLAQLEDLVAVAQRALDDEEAKGGRPPAPSNRLALDVARKLRPAAGGVDNACDLAERILIACRVPVPSRETIARMLRAT